MKNMLKHAVVLLMSVALLLADSDLQVFAGEIDIPVEEIAERNEEECSDSLELYIDKNEEIVESTFPVSEGEEVILNIDEDANLEAIEIEDVPENLCNIEETKLENEGIEEVEQEYALESENKCGEKATWAIENGILRISGSGDMYRYAEGEAPWANNEEITELVIGNDISFVHNHAFDSIPNITKITMPVSLIIDGTNTFSRYPNLDTVEFTKGTGYGIDYRYGGSERPWWINDANGLTMIFDEGVVDTGDLFSGCQDIKKISVAKSVLYVGNKTDCVLIKSVGPVGSGSDFEYGWTDKIPDGAFQGLTNVTSVSIGPGVKSIGSKAFSKTAITELIIPSSVVSIGTSCFYDCSKLSHIVVPDSVKMVGEAAFCGTDLKSAGPIGEGFDYEFGWVKNIPDNAFSSCGELTEVYIPESCERIGNSAFRSCSNLNNIAISDNCVEIGSLAFAHSGLMSIKLPSHITKISEGMFEYCEKLKYLDVPEEVKVIETYAFLYSGLRRIDLPASVTDIQTYAFAESNSLNYVSMSEQLNRIDSYAFSYCSSLKNIEMPKSISYVGNYAFYGSGIREITIPQSVSYLGGSSFDTSVVIKGYSNTVAERYANDNGNEFISIGEGQTGTVVPSKPAEIRMPKPLSSVSSDKTIASGTRIRLHSSVSNANIYYTLDGTIPTTQSAKYVEPFIIEADHEQIVLKAIAVKEGYLTSETASYVYHIVSCNEELLGDVRPEDVPAGEVTAIPQGLWIAGINDNGYEYTGTKIIPDIRVYSGNSLLSDGLDYSVSCSNNIAAAASDSSRAPKVSVIGKGNYSGNASVKFTINPKNINDPDITIEELILPTNSKVQKAAPSILLNGKKLKIISDYSVVYPETGNAAYKNPGNYRITVQGKGNFIGTREVTETITAAKIMKNVSVSSLRNQNYTGEEITFANMSQPPVVKYGRIVLQEGVHYTVEYINNVNIGKATAILSGTGEYTEEGIFVGTKEVSFNIAGTAISKAQMKDFVSSVEYTGNEVEQNELILTFNGNELRENMDYVLQYSNNTSVGTATVLIRGMGAFSGEIKKRYKITPYNLSSDEGNLVSVEYDVSYPYVKGGVKPHPEVTWSGEHLVEGRDYTLSYKNNTSVNDGGNDKKQPTIVIKGRGNYKGTINETDWTIEPRDISDVCIDVPDKVFSNKKNGWKSAPVLTDDSGKILKAGTDYSKDVVYEYLNETELENGEVRFAGDNVEASDVLPIGTIVKVTIMALDANYEGEISDTYEIAEKNFSGCKISVANKEYTGQEVILFKEDITVKDGNDLLEYGTDYEVIRYSDNIKKGTAYVTIKGNGAYGGLKTVKFKIIAKKMDLILKSDAEKVAEALAEAARQLAEEAARQATVAGLTPIHCKDGTCYVTAAQLATIHATWDFAGDAIEMAGHHNIGELEAVIGPTVH